ncbi:O-antigen ligase domain-containing protein [Synechococcus sp. RSCCF101]|uniref:O-antigen ligase family protein n=1 Tax=Synechococcus sp. RSCCF101 TaxID=2511069 RepID=UPI0012443E2A|nr:O-antigen ligase family protein [Synechococcus sp. RSCCF101]QEY32604.1 O-antigen ligase domain-containing protein [Synechococcus sp. RSCCF101]
MRLPALASGLPTGASPLGWRCFQIGLLLLPSSALLASALFVVALVLGCRGRSPWWRDSCNRVLLVVATLMLLGTLRADRADLAWAGLANWLPFFWGFWGFQPYVAAPPARRRAALWLVAGTVPVILTGLGQMWAGWRGPWQLLGGLIIWHMSPGGEPEGRLSGLFDYANIAGSWLALVWPLALAALLQRGLSRGRRLTVLLIAAGLVAALLLTDSRNAWGALLLALPLVAGPASWLWLLPVLLLALLPVLVAVLPGVPSGWQEAARALVPEGIWGRLSDAKHAAERVPASTRLGQWGVALGLIGERPWLGWGAAAFTVLYPARTGQWHGHPHNLPIEMAVSFGVPAALLLVGMVVGLLGRSARRGMAGGALFERAWWAAALVLLSLHATDIPLYDSRLNIAGWILLAGLRGRQPAETRAGAP